MCIEIIMIMVMIVLLVEKELLVIACLYYEAYNIVIMCSKSDCAATDDGLLFRSRRILDNIVFSKVYGESTHTLFGSLRK